jgi:hypothetical protein
MKTVLSKGHAKIPQIHIRVVSYENGLYLYEIIAQGTVSIIK